MTEEVSDQVTCPVCKEEFDQDTWENESMIGQLTGEVTCGECEVQDLQDASTLVVFRAEGGVEKVIFGDHYGYCDEYGEVPRWFTDLLGEGWTGRPYVRTSAWRGYHNTDFTPTLTQVEDGWMTGAYDDVPWKHGFHQLMEELDEAAKHGVAVCPADLFFLFEPTSNVFSTATTVYCKPEDEEMVREWLAQRVDLHRVLS